MRRRASGGAARRGTSGPTRPRRVLRGPGRAGRRPLAPASGELPPTPARGSVVSTGRVVTLVLVVLGLGLSWVYPVRTYLHQQSAIAAMHQQVVSDRSAVAELEVGTAQWQDPAFVARQARERLRLVRRGETGYIVTDSAPEGGQAGPARPGAPPSPAAPGPAPTPSGAASPTAPTAGATPVVTGPPGRAVPGGSPVVPGPQPTVPATGTGGYAGLGSPSPWWSPPPGR